MHHLSYARSKSRKKLAEKLKGKGLGELSDNEDESALTWIKKSRKREKELAMKRAKELEEMDEMFEKNGTEYSAGKCSTRFTEITK